MRLPPAEPGRSKSYQRPVVTTRYPYERTWSVATYLSPIAVRSRTSCIAAPLDAQDMPNRASTDPVVPKPSIGGMTRSATSGPMHRSEKGIVFAPTALADPITLQELSIRAPSCAGLALILLPPVSWPRPDKDGSARKSVNRVSCFRRRQSRKATRMRPLSATSPPMSGHRVRSTVGQGAASSRLNLGSCPWP